MIAVGNNIRIIRELKNLTQDYMAEKLDVSTGYYSNIENDKTDITLNNLEKIANVLGVDYQQILNLNPTQIFNNCVYSGYSGNNTQYVSNSEELSRQLETKDKQLDAKDEQIRQLSALLDKALKG